MRFKFLILLLAFVTCFAGCASSADRDQRNQEVRLTKLIDQRRYNDVIRLVEENPGDSAHYQGLLAMAYLGRAGFEPVRFGTQILTPQTNTDPQLDLLVPGCDPSAIQSPSDQPIKCILKRIWSYLPDPDGADFAKARGLLLATYPKPEDTTPEYNTLIAVVEAASALARVERIAVKYQSLDPHQVSDTDLVALFKQIGATATDALQALQRAQRSIKKVSQVLTGIDQMPLFAGTGLDVQWIESTGLPLLIQYSNGLSSDAEAVAAKVETLKLLYQLIQSIQQ